MLRNTKYIYLLTGLESCHLDTVLFGLGKSKVTRLGLLQPLNVTWQNRESVEMMCNNYYQ